MALNHKYPQGMRDGDSPSMRHAIFKPQTGGNTAVTGGANYTVPANTVLIRIVTTTAGTLNFPAWGATADPGETNACYFPVGVEYMHVKPGMIINSNAAYVGQICAME